MAYLSDDELLDTEGGFTGWDDGTGTGAAEETLEQALAEERLAELEKMCIRDSSGFGKEIAAGGLSGSIPKSCASFCAAS